MGDKNRKGALKWQRKLLETLKLKESVY